MDRPRARPGPGGGSLAETSAVPGDPFNALSAGQRQPGQSYVYVDRECQDMLVVEPVRDGDLDPVSWLAYRALARGAVTARTGWPTMPGAQGHLPSWPATFPTNRIVGFALADQQALRRASVALAVDAHRRGEGIGSALLKNVRDHMARQGAYKLTSRCAPTTRRRRSSTRGTASSPKDSRPTSTATASTPCKMARSL